MMHDNGNLHDRVTKLRIEVEEIQKALDKNPADPILREEEDTYVHAFNEAKLDEERFLKQKSQDVNGLEYIGLSVPEAFVNHYKDFLGTDMLCDDMDSTDLFLKQVLKSSYNNMVCDIMNVEIKFAMFDIGDDRAPGPDGFSLAFFKKGWDILGDDVCKSIRDFFRNRQILREINHTFIALIPKVSIPLRINDYRPISCYNVIYKCISKILTNCIISCIKDVVSDNQSAFIPSRRISYNILITQELMHNYHRKRGPPRCASKVDIQKAYDTVDWKFLEHILHKFGFNLVMIK
ncbi:aspartic peptidase [Tanacetum coccineum]